MNLWTAAALVAMVNLPFGYWRTSADRYSRPWFLAVHLPVPFVIAIRTLSGLGWHLSTFPVMIGAFFAGQYLGGQLHGLLKRYTNIPVSACLVWDIVNGLGITKRAS